MAIFVEPRPECVHVTVRNPKSERSAVQRARAAATEYYGRKVGHYVSSGGSHRDGITDYVYVFTMPR